MALNECFLVALFLFLHRTAIHSTVIKSCIIQAMAMEF